MTGCTSKSDRLERKSRVKWHDLSLRIGALLSGFFATVLLVHWSWNLCVPECFGGAVVSVKNAFGLTLLAMLAGFAVLRVRCDPRRVVKNVSARNNGGV